MDLILLLIGLLLILGTGFFVAVEFSLVALEAATVQQAKDSGDKAADAVLRCLKTLSTQLSSCQIGITITTLLTGYTLDAAIKALTTDAIGSLGLPSGLIDVLTLVLAMLIATLLSMVMGELLPKGLAIADPYNVARRLAPFQLNFTRIISPLVRIMNGSANWILGRFGMEAKEELSAARTPDELSSMVRRSAKEGTLDSAVARFLDRTLRFSELTASEVMTPRGQVSMLEDTAPVSDIIELARSTGHSRFPLYKGDHDNIVGVVHVKKAVGVPPGVRGTLEAGALAEDVLQVPETLHLDALLTQLRQGALQLAVVLDEYGGTAGIATLEDLVEEIVGEVSDEHDRGRTERPLRYGNGDWVFSGLRRPDEINALIPGLEVEESPEYETVGGFMMDRLGRIPEIGDTVPVTGGTLRVDALEGRRVDRIRFTPDSEENSAHEDTAPKKGVRA